MELTAGPGNSTGPVWSKQGNQIAFERLAGSHADIAVIGTDGKGEKTLTSGTGKNGGPVWRP
jgi:TolB protein